MRGYELSYVPGFNSISSMPYPAKLLTVKGMHTNYDLSHYLNEYRKTQNQ